MIYQISGGEGKDCSYLLVRASDGSFQAWILQCKPVKHVLVGLKQRDLKVDKVKNKKGRLPVTLEVLRTLRKQIRKSGWALGKKRLVWAVCIFRFSGSFRVHEILSRKRAEFDLDRFPASLEK